MYHKQLPIFEQNSMPKRGWMCAGLWICWHNAALQWRIRKGGNVNTEFGHRIYLTGVGTDVTEDDLRAYLFKYIEKLPSLIERVDLNSALPAYVIGFKDLADGEIQQFAARINGMFWHGHVVNAHVM